MVTPLWVLSPTPSPRAQAAPRADPLHPRFRRRGLAGAEDSGAAAAAARGVWPGPGGPGAAPGLALDGGGRPAGTAAPPRIARKGEVLLPGSEESYAGAEWGWEIGSRPGAAPRRGRGRDRSGGHPKAVSPDSRRPSLHARNEKLGVQAVMFASPPCQLDSVLLAHTSPRAGPFRQGPDPCLGFLLLFCPFLSFSFLFCFFSFLFCHSSLALFLIIRVKGESFCLQNILRHSIPSHLLVSAGVEELNFPTGPSPTKDDLRPPPHPSQKYIHYLVPLICWHL